MIAVDIATLLIVIAGVVAGITALSSHRAQTKALHGSGDHRLLEAVRLLDRMISSHEGGYATIPDNLLQEAKAIVAQFYSK